MKKPIKNIQYISLYFFYVNNENEVYTVKKKRVQTEDHIFSLENQMNTIKENQYNIFNKHKLISLSYFNFNVNDNEIDNIIEKELDKRESLKYVNKLEIVDTIKFDKNSDVFDKINSIFYIYKILENSQNTTKKVIINQKNRKTRRA